MARIVLTGGPGSGKTSLAQAMDEFFGDRLTVVPEAATILWRGGFPRGVSGLEAMAQQRAIYGVQVALEQIHTQDSRKGHLLFDRGTLDGLVYWPTNSSNNFFDALNTDLPVELARYDWVVHLGMAPESHYGGNNPTRNETFKQAYDLGHRVAQAWSAHPNQIYLRNDSDIERKATNLSELLPMLFDRPSIQALYEQGGHLLESRSSRPKFAESIR